MARPTTYSPLIIPIVRACATFGATAPEIANYIGTSIASFDRWTMEHEELREALKRGREAMLVLRKVFIAMRWPAIRQHRFSG
jgi:hypothetical protein